MYEKGRHLDKKFRSAWNYRKTAFCFNCLPGLVLKNTKPEVTEYGPNEVRYLSHDMTT